MKSATARPANLTVVPEKPPVNILAIESSCDDTAAAVCQDGIIRSNLVAGQAVHRAFGGVVPELASRAHLQQIVPVVDQALQTAGIGLNMLHAVAFTQAPGLIGSLMVGAQFAKSLALALEIPMIAVNHLQAHVLANLIEEPKPAFPFLCLTVSGGHTQLVVCHSALQMEIIGETLDDAAGEAFDKSAKLFGLPYPGGPLIDELAQEGNPDRFSFPEPQVPGLDFSFSGLKTAVLYSLRDQEAADPHFLARNLPDFCASLQQRIVSILLHKLERAARQTGIQEICLAGGVAANRGLREALKEVAKENHWNSYIPRMEYCTDNAAMIAITAYFKFQTASFADLSATASARGSW